ncbi:MAG TPA: ATP-binding cassette domain-containing protein [Stellaceae bacterium]|nr:ATP-binding cassette domain-containing protein [Stellaceae bacterium]
MVELEQIGKRFADGAQILSEVSLRLEPGGFYFLTGASGTGKTTLLQIICLAQPPSHGRLTLFGTDTAGLDRPARAALRRRMGIVFQDFRLIDEMSAGDNVALPLRVTGATPRQIRDNVPELLAWVGLAERGEAPAATLSGGERQRLAIARAVVRRPELLLADEPAGNVDDDVALGLMRVFERINQLGTTVLIATHDLAFARRFGHQHFHLDRRELLDAGGAPVP